MKASFVFLLVCLNFTTWAQKSSDLFKNGDRVVFVGNSITHAGEFTKYISLFYATRFPGEKVAFYNAGIAGDVAAGIISRMDSDVLVHKPTIAVLMVGMNDVGRDLYDIKNVGDTAIDRKKLKALDNYKKNVLQIADKFQQFGCSSIFELPTIYDETSKFSKPTLIGVNGALGKCAGYLSSIAPKYNARLVDYYSIMNEVNKEQQMKDSAFTIVGKDRVHPGPPGYLVMAYQFLKSTGASAYISKTIIDAGKSEVSEALNCSVKLKSSTKTELSFESVEKALPYPVPNDAKPALNYISFTKDLNLEILQLKNMKAGNYSLYIDEANIGVFSSKALAEGINLALETLTPQYLQAVKVMKLCSDYHNICLNLRSIAYTEYKLLGSSIKNSFDENKLLLENKPNAGFSKTMAEQYIKYKPIQKELINRLDIVRDSIYITNVPGKHIFKLIKI